MTQRTLISKRILVLIFILVHAIFLNLNAQNAEKHRVRLKANYIKIMDSLSYVDIAASARIDKQNIDVSGIEILVFNIADDSELELGKVVTNKKGRSSFIIRDLNSIQPDSNDTYHLDVVFNGNDTYQKASRSISFKNASIETELVVRDSTNYISAVLKDLSNDSLIPQVSLKFQVQRLIKPLPFGEIVNYTNEIGTVIVPIESDIPGIDGNLNIEVVLDDHDTYGTVKSILKAPIGIPIVEESTFDKRTLWATRDKTPWFILIFTNLLIISVWGIIIYLIINLFKISKQ